MEPLHKIPKIMFFLLRVVFDTSDFFICFYSAWPEGWQFYKYYKAKMMLKKNKLSIRLEFFQK